MNVDKPVTRTAIDQDAVQRSVRHASGLLPVFRTAFLLCDIQGFTVAEVAAILRISPAAVKARLDRARRLLSVRMREVMP